MKNGGEYKLAFMCMALIEAVCMGYLPVKWKKFRDSPKILGVANAFAGGIFVSIALMHIIPE